MPNPRPVKPRIHADAVQDFFANKALRAAFRLGWISLLISTGTLWAQLPATVLLSRSVSGQFIVQSGRDALSSPVEAFLANDTNFVRLDPRLLTISCERIKQLVWRMLGATAQWSGKVFLRLYSADSADSRVVIEAEQFGDGWHYRLRMPNICQRERYVRAIVSVLLLEMANRDAPSHSAEVPLWLSEGVSREIWASNQKEIILTPPQMSDAGLRMTTLMISARRESSLDLAHQELCAGRPLSFQQLSWPTPEPLTGEPGELYRSCAQLFVHQLLGLPNGQACLRTMLQSLPRYYNWQFAFMEAFHEQFREALDVEKWWSLQYVHFTGRELTENWTAEESWEKLDQIVRSAVQIRIGTNELPLHSEIALQTVIRDWPAPRQTPALESKIREMEMIRPRLSRELSGLVDEYCNALTAYLQNLNHPGFVLPFRKGVVARHNSGEVLQQLDALDARRLSLRPAKSEETPTRPVSRPAPLS